MWDADELELSNRRLQREMWRLDGFNPRANACMKRAHNKVRREFRQIQGQASVIPPVADLVRDLDPDLVPETVTEDETPSPTPRVEPTPTPTEMVETALAGMDYDKVDQKKYRKIFTIPRTCHEAVNYSFEWQ
jgi:hypothetical protein